MKKLNKLQINSEKIMKNEELLSLRGGYDICADGYVYYQCDCTDGSGSFDSCWGPSNYESREATLSSLCGGNSHCTY